MDIIALTGKSSCGKSETLNIVYQFLLKEGYIQVQNGVHFEVLGNPKQRDFIDILENGNKKVGIVTPGDYPDFSVRTNLLILEKAGCNIAITACTTDNQNPILQLNKYYPNNIKILKTLATIDSQERIANNLDAQTIFNLLTI